MPQIVILFHKSLTTNLKFNIMKKQVQLAALFLLILTSFTSCEVIGGIFKAGMGVGIFIVVAVIALIIFVISKIGGNK